MGTEGNDSLISGPGDDTLDGGAGNDSAFYVFATSGVAVDLNITGPQAVGGGLGSDTLISIENLAGSFHDDTLIGDTQANELAGLEGDDVLVGGGGNDLLAGGTGGDEFKFSFTRSEGQARESFTGWLAEQGLSLDGANQGFFASNYTAYLQHLVIEYGIGEDLDGDGSIQVDINQNDSGAVPVIEGLSREAADALFGDASSVMVKTGKHAQERWYSDSFATGGGETTVASAEGHDVILDFEWDADTLDFAGLGAMTLDEFLVTFSVTEADQNGDGVLDTVVALEGEVSWSVTLVGVSGHTEAALYDQINFA